MNYPDKNLIEKGIRIFIGRTLLNPDTLLSGRHITDSDSLAAATQIKH